jgi:hypothetical protein
VLVCVRARANRAMLPASSERGRGPLRFVRLRGARSSGAFRWIRDLRASGLADGAAAASEGALRVATLADAVVFGAGASVGWMMGPGAPGQQASVGWLLFHVKRLGHLARLVPGGLSACARESRTRTVAGGMSVLRTCSGRGTG